MGWDDVLWGILIIFVALYVVAWIWENWRARQSINRIDKLEARGRELAKQRYGKPLVSHKRESQYPSNWDDIRRQAKQRDGYRCGNCGSNTNLHVHHIVPLSKGGTNQLSNLRTLCEGCHKKLHPYMR